MTRQYRTSSYHIVVHKFTCNSKVKLTIKNLVHKGVDFYVQNALKLAYEHL